MDIALLQHVLGDKSTVEYIQARQHSDSRAPDIVYDFYSMENADQSVHRYINCWIAHNYMGDCYGAIVTYTGR